MYVPIVVPSTTSYGRTTVVNKTIIYQDTVLNLKEKGVNLNVTKIKVEISSFENCMNTIFESNPDVIFNTVQYSHKNEEAIFYTDKKISTEKWEKRHEQILTTVPQAATIIEAVEEVLKYEDTLDPECISAFDIWSVYKEIDVETETFKKQIERRIDTKLKEINSNNWCVLHDFNYTNNELHLYIKTYRDNNFYFRKNNGDLYLYKRDDFVSFNVLTLLGADIEEYYDYCSSLAELNKQRCYNIKSKNCDFYCDFSGISVSIDNSSKFFNDDFEVQAFSNGKKFKCDCNSNNIVQLLSGRENEFAKKNMVPISECPLWMQEKLYEIRKQQVEQIQKVRIEKEQEEKRMERKRIRKQKRRAFLKKIFPFVK